MPRVNFVKKARKNYPDEGIKKGDSYFHWKFRYGGLHRSRTHPKQSQLTQSEYLSEAYSIEEDLAELTAETVAEDGFSLDEYIDRIRALGEMAEERRSNMPDQLQDSETGELLQNRADAMEDWASQLEAIDVNIDRDSILAEIYGEGGEDEGKTMDDAVQEAILEKAEEILEEIQGCNVDIQ